MSQTYNSATSDVPPKTIKIGVGGSNYEDVFFGNKYTYENGVVSKTELVIYDNADRDGAIVIGEIRKNGTIDFNNIAKTKTIGNSDLKWNDISRNNKKYLEKEIKKISNNENTWEALGVNTDNEKLNEFLKKNGINNVSEETIDDTVRSKTAAVNKQLIQKSKQFRKEYGNYCYPLEMKSTDQDRLKITVIDFKPADLETREENTFELQRGGTEKIRGSAILPIPNGVTDQNAVNFGDGTLNPLQVAGAQTALNTILSGLGEGGSSLGKQVESALSDEGTSAAIANLLTSLTIGTSPNQLLARTQGAIFNNNLSLLFSGPTLRPFNFNFNVSPRDQKESIEVQKIIRMFKQSSAVQRTQNGLYLGTPHIFRLEFLSGGQPHKFLPRIKECALLTFSTNYMPNNTYMTYENSSMVAYNLSFQFKEIDPIFNDDYDKIDLDGGEFKDGDVFAGFDRGPTDPNTLTIDSFTADDPTDSGGIGF
jgi:hypothetical protein